jgi:hypothetical protein
MVSEYSLLVPSLFILNHEPSFVAKYLKFYFIFMETQVGGSNPVLFLKNYIYFL